LNYLNIPVNPPYLKPLKTPKNELGLPNKPYYFTRDVCKVLNVSPDTFRARIYAGHYPEYGKIGVKRIFTLDQIKELIRITENLIRKGILSAGTSD
jgi:hypothetical protein